MEGRHCKWLVRQRGQKRLDSVLRLLLTSCWSNCSMSCWWMWKGILLAQCALDGAPSCLPPALWLYNWSPILALCQQAIWYIVRFDFSQFLHVVLQLLVRKSCSWSLQGGWTRWHSEVHSNQFMVRWFYEKQIMCSVSVFLNELCGRDSPCVPHVTYMYILCIVCQCMTFLLPVENGH